MLLASRGLLEQMQSERIPIDKWAGIKLESDESFTLLPFRNPLYSKR